MKMKYQLQEIDDIYYIYVKINNRKWEELYSTSNQSEALKVMIELNGLIKRNEELLSML